MTKERIKAIHQALEKALEEVGTEYGFSITNGTRITYTDTGFTFKAEVGFTKDESGNEVDPNRALFEERCVRFGLRPEDYLREVRVYGVPDIFIITGIKPKARKNPIIIKQKSTGKEYVCSTDRLDDLKGKPLLENHHRCKYCGELAAGPDEDVLCYNCRSLFGHALYSEL